MHTLELPAPHGHLLSGLGAAGSRSSLPWLAAFLAALCRCHQLLANPGSFRNDVMAILSKAGCNQGACHGNQNGKNGFKLSLRGQEPEFDFLSLSRDAQGRRIDRLNPNESLVLLKATAKVPHE